MYNITYEYSDCSRPYYETYLIEADGEADNLFIDQCYRDGYASRYFYAIDDISHDEIELDAYNYMGERKFNQFEKLLNNYTEEDGDLTYTKTESWYIACLKAKR